MTAIALAESGGNSRAHNPYGEDSRGLWQINARAHPDLAQRYDLYDPVQNARAAYAVSRHGADISPWTVTHGGTGARYLRHREAAQDAAVAYGDGPGHGVWTGTSGYGHRVSAERPGGDDSRGSDGGQSGRSDGDRDSDGGDRDGDSDAALRRFIEVARNQVGDRYVFGAETSLDNRDPKVFDCSELTQWAAHQAGIKIPDGATAQYLFLKQRNLLISVEEAKRTPGALLFGFNREPRPGEGERPEAHVAISLGRGRTVEAQNSAVGVVEDKAGQRFQYAALLPGIADGTADPPPSRESPSDDPPASADRPADVVDPPPDMGGPDTDRDGLTNKAERRLGLDPFNEDTDGDHIADGDEMATTCTDPRRADSDNDKLNDFFELACGLDPTSPDSNADGHLDGSFAADQLDSDLDGLDNDLETALYLNPRLADSDRDGFSDRLEVHAGSAATDRRATPLQAAADRLRADDTPAIG